MYYTFCLKSGQSGRNDAESGIWKAESGNAVILLTAVRFTDRMNLDSSKKSLCCQAG